MVNVCSLSKADPAAWAAKRSLEERWPFLSQVTDRSTKVSEAHCIGLSRDFCSRCLRGCLWGKTKIDLDFFYLATFDGEELRIPGAAAILDCAAVEDEGLVAFFKQLLNAIGGGFLGVGPAPFEIRFTVNAIIVWTGKH
jgi:hypothetical protein